MAIAEEEDILSQHQGFWFLARRVAVAQMTFNMQQLSFANQTR
jgi:hypothetical protein